MDPEEIAKIKFFHRPSTVRRGSRVVFGCTCGAEIHPCETLTAALDEEQAVGEQGGPGPAGEEGTAGREGADPAGRG